MPSISRTSADSKSWKALSLKKWDEWIQKLSIRRNVNNPNIVTHSAYNTKKAPVKPLAEKNWSTKEVKKAEWKARCYHYWFNEHAVAQEMIQYACDISYYDHDFILTLNAENWGWNINAMNRNKNGTFDKGLCQFNSQYYSHIINDKRFSDWKFQLDNCLKLYKWGTRFYWFDVRYKRSRWLVLIGNNRY